MGALNSHLTINTVLKTPMNQEKVDVTLLQILC